MTAVHLVLTPALMLPAVATHASESRPPWGAIRPQGEPAPGIRLAQSQQKDPESSAKDPGSTELGVRYGRHETFDRFAFEWSEPVEVDFAKSGNELILTFDRGAEATLPPEEVFRYLWDQWPQIVFAVRAEAGGSRYRIEIDPNVRVRIHRWNDGRLIAVDLHQQTPPGLVADAGDDPSGQAPSVDEVTGSSLDADEGDVTGDDAAPLSFPAETAPVESAPAELADAAPDRESDADGEGAAELIDDAGDDAIDPDGDAEDEAEDEGEVSDEGEGGDEDEGGEEGEFSDEGEDGDEDDGEDEDAGSGNDFATLGDFEIYLGASLQVGVSTAADDRLSDGEGDPGYAFFTDTEVYVGASATVLEDVGIGAYVTLEGDANIDEVNADSTYLYAFNDFGTVEIGRTSGAEDDMALGADTIAAGTGGIDGDVSNLADVKVDNTGDASKVSYYTPRIGGVQFGLSYTPDTGDSEGQDSIDGDLENHLGVGLNFVETYGDAELSLATVGSFADNEEFESDDLSSYSVGGTLSFEPIQLGASVGQAWADDDFDFATLGISASLGETYAGIGYNYLDEDSSGRTHVIVLSGNRSILPGVELQGDISYADPENDDDNIASVFALEMGF